MKKILSYLLFSVYIFSSMTSAEPQTFADPINDEIDANTLKQLGKQIETLQKGLLEGDIDNILSVYDADAIVMPEYQPTLNGQTKIRAYYNAMHQKRTFTSLEFDPQEQFMLEDYLFEIGNFEVDIDWYSQQKNVTETLPGKYWRVWKKGADGKLLVVGETFGFFKTLENAAWWMTDKQTRKDSAPSGFQPAQASIELKAYHAVGVVGVKHKDGNLRADLYAEDAVFYPYAKAPQQGIEVLRPYLLEYSSHDAYVDAVQTHTHEVVYLNSYILEFTKFDVAWYYAGTPGHADGKGMRLWQRQANGELRIFRHFGTHNFR